MTKKTRANRNTARFNMERQYIVFFHSENIGLGWNESDVPVFRQLWEDGMSILTIAEQLDRTPLEVLLLIVDQAEQELIELRPTGIFGW